ncbi:MAG: trigger factor [Desulfatibacillum sp.]|nr:trigger factor [Desulfatibacillum sp.]
MQVTVEDLSSVKKVLHVEVPAEEVKKALDSSYAELKKKAKVKGFRPGKTPKSVLERLYKTDVEADVSGEIISDSFRDAILQTELKIVGPPDITPPPIVPDAVYAYDATVEIFPELPDLDLKGIELSKNMYKATDQEIDTQISMIRKNMASLETDEEDRPAKEEDFVLVDYEGICPDGQPDELRFTENFTMEVGTGRILKDFDDQVVGMKRGEEKDFEVTFPEEYFNKELAGKHVKFHVMLKEIRKQILPELDDDFARDLGEYTSMEQLRNSIRDHLQQGYDRRAEQETDEQVYQALLGRVEFEVPETLITHEVSGMVSESERALSYRDMTIEDTGTTKEELESRYREPAEQQVRRYLLLDKIVEQEKVELPEEELDAAFKGMAESLRQPFEMVKKYYASDAEQMSMLRHTLLQKEALKYVKNLNEIKEVELELQKEEE